MDSAHLSSSWPSAKDQHERLEGVSDPECHRHTSTTIRQTVKKHLPGGGFREVAHDQEQQVYRGLQQCGNKECR